MSAQKGDEFEIPKLTAEEMPVQSGLRKRAVLDTV